LAARSIAWWRSRYEITADGQVVTTWRPNTWRTGGSFALAGRRYHLKSNVWGSRYELTDEMDLTIATAERVGRKRWTVEANGRTYHFERASLWRPEESLVADGERVGSVRRVSVLRRDAVADLPGLPLPIQVFVLAIVLTMWERREAAAAAGRAS